MVCMWSRAAPPTTPPTAFPTLESTMTLPALSQETSNQEVGSGDPGLFIPDELIGGRFRILREVAHGGMGIVYEAVDEKLDRHIAIKCAKRGFGQWLSPEVRHAREVSHPNVCKIFEIHTASTAQGKRDFITMEYLDGETLTARLSRDRPSHAETMAIAKQICAGLAAAHRHNVIHGDLKTNNVILVREANDGFRAVITDFGLARPIESMQPLEKTRLGTPDYMAPELFHGEKPSVRSDIYALGIVLFELMTGVRHLHAKIRPRALARCIHPDPAMRFQDVESVWRALDPSRSRRAFLAAALTVTVLGGTTRVLNQIHPTSREGIPSVAVIPFTNVGGSPGDQFLADGISESVINALAELPPLKVVARNSSFKYQAASISVPDAAAALNAKALVMGRVATMDRQLRITVELINGSDGSQIWGAPYNQSMDKLAAVQAQISHDIAQQIRFSLTRPEQEKLAKWANTSPAAYELLLRGRYQRRLYRTDSWLKAIAYFEQALALDPSFALANGELALTHRHMSAGGVLDPQEALPKAEAAARRALAFDANLAEAHLALAEVQKDRWEWAEAGNEYRRTLDTNPSLIEAHQGYAIYLSEMARYGEAVYEIERAIELDPLGLQTLITAIAVFYNADRFDDAMKAALRAEQLDPMASVPWTWKGMIYGATGRFEEAIEAYEKAFRLGDNTGVTQCYYAYSLARSGRSQRALEILRNLQASNTFVPVPAYAFIYLGLNQKESAMRILEKAFEMKDSMLQYLKVEAHFDLLKDEPRYQLLAASIGLP